MMKAFAVAASALCSLYFAVAAIGSYGKEPYVFLLMVAYALIFCILAIGMWRWP